jgi:hypothetical protein
MDILYGYRTNFSSKYKSDMDCFVKEQNVIMNTFNVVDISQNNHNISHK